MVDGMHVRGDPERWIVGAATELASLMVVVTSIAKHHMPLVSTTSDGIIWWSVISSPVKLIDPQHSIMLLSRPAYEEHLQVR